jgi:hypothetical protein
LPFDGRDAGDILVKHLTQDPVPLKKVRSDVPDDLAAAVMRCLTKDREARWPDARRLREAIAPTGLDEEQLPEPLDGLDGVAPRTLPIALLWLLSAWHLRVASDAGQQPNTVAILLAIVLGAVLIYQIPWLSSAVRLARRRGFAWSMILGALLRQPPRWRPFWYPPRFRRPWDVWARLPRPFRVFRGGLTLLLATFLVLVPVTMRVMSQLELAQARQHAVPPLPPFVIEIAFALLALVATVVASLAFGARHVLGLGYDTYTRRVVASALLSGPTAQRSLWRRAEVARALLPAAREHEATPHEPSTPRDYATAIAKARGAAAEAEAEALLAEIGRLDSELARLAADADPEEAARNRQRLDALGSESVEEGEERRQRRRLLREQLELAARVETRLKETQARRDDRLEALRSLWRAAVSSTEADAIPTKTAPR